MATPIKFIPDPDHAVCRCCSKSLRKYDCVDLFNIKSGDFIASLKEFGEIEVKENDVGVRPTKICRSCHRQVNFLCTKISNFRAMCLRSKLQQDTSISNSRFKRGRKEGSPSEPENKKKEKEKSRSESSLTRSCLFGKFQQVSPESIGKDSPESEPRVSNESVSVEILKNCGLRNTKFLKLHHVHLNKETIDTLWGTIKWGIVTDIAKEILKVDSLKRAIKLKLLKELDDQCQALCVRTKGTPSVLKVDQKSTLVLEEVSWDKVMVEMKERAPDLLDFIATVAAPKMKKNPSEQIPPNCNIYSSLMNQRWQELNLVQKIATIILGVGNTTKKTFERLNTLGLCQSRTSYIKVMDSVGSDLIQKIRGTMKENPGKEIRATFDNFDFKILANIILNNHKNSDYHWMVHYFTFDRFSSSGLDDSKPLVEDMDSFHNNNYLLNKSELSLMKRDFIVIVARILVEFFSFLEPLKPVIPQHIEHEYTKEMSEKSTIISLPIAPYNECKHSDMVQYLEMLQNDLLTPIFAPEEECPLHDNLTPSERLERTEKILEGKKVPLYGDLLSRERVTGAKKTRAGCNHRTEKFETIVESHALWHMKQAFLGYIWEQLYKTHSSRDVGTLYHLRQNFGLVNVKSKVKSNFEGANSLMISATKSYICCAFMTWSGLQDLKGTPKKIRKIESSFSDQDKQDYMNDVIGEFVDKYIMVECDVENSLREQRQQAVQAPQQQPLERDHEPGLHQTKETSQPTQASGALNAVISPTLQFQTGNIVALLHKETSSSKPTWIAVGKVINPTQQDFETQRNLVSVYVAYVVTIPELSFYNLQVGQQVLWNKDMLALCNLSANQNNTMNKTIAKPENDSKKTGPVPVPILTTGLPSTKEEKDDRVLNYGLQILQLGTILMQLHDTEKEGDGNRNIRNMKLLILYFRARPRGMKYAYEIMRCLTLVKALYTEKMAHRLIHGHFVNWKGGPGNNVANDLKQEHLVKYNKAILKGMAGNKTLNAVERATKAAYGMKTIINNFDKICDVPPDSTSHTSATKENDEKEMIEIIKKLDPFTFTSGRLHNAFPTIPKSPLDQLDVIKLDAWLTKHKRTLSTINYYNAECDEATNYDEEEQNEDSDEEEIDFEI